MNDARKETAVTQFTQNTQPNVNRDVIWSLWSLTENVASPAQSRRRLSKFALQLAVRLPPAAGGIVSLLVSAWSVDVGRCLLRERRLATSLDRSTDTAEHTDDGLPTTSMTTINAYKIVSNNGRDGLAAAAETRSSLLTERSQLKSQR